MADQNGGGCVNEYDDGYKACGDGAAQQERGQAEAPANDAATPHGARSDGEQSSSSSSGPGHRRRRQRRRSSYDPCLSGEDVVGPPALLHRNMATAHERDTPGAGEQLEWQRLGREQRRCQRQETQQQQLEGAAPALAQVEAELMGVGAAAHPNLAALVASLLLYSASSRRPHPKNPVALLFEVAHALGCRPQFAFEPLPAGYRAMLSAEPVAALIPKAAQRDHVIARLDAPVPGTPAAVAALGAASGEGQGKRDAKNAAAAAALERLLTQHPGVASLAWRAAVGRFPLDPGRWRKVAAGSAKLMAEMAAEPVPKDIAQYVMRQQQKVARQREQELERRRKEEQRQQDQRREQQQWAEKAQPPGHVWVAGQAVGQQQQQQQQGTSGAGRPAADAVPDQPALRRHVDALVGRQPGAPAPTPLALLNQYAPAAMLEVEFDEVERTPPGGASNQLHECTAVVRTRLQRTEVACQSATARSKRDARQKAAAAALEALLIGHDGIRRVAEAEETGERARRAKRASLAAAVVRPRSLLGASIDYSQPLAKRFKSGGAVQDSDSIELLAPQRQRWGLGYGPAEAWQQQLRLVAPLPAQAAFLGIAPPVVPTPAGAAVRQTPHQPLTQQQYAQQQPQQHQHNHQQQQQPHHQPRQPQQHLQQAFHQQAFQHHQTAAHLAAAQAVQPPGAGLNPAVVGGAIGRSHYY